MKAKLIGVTSALSSLGAADYSFCEEEKLWRGSEVHRACELFDRRTLNEAHLRRNVPEVWEYLQGWKKFREQNHFVPTKIELPVRDKERGYVGRLDRVGLLKGSRCLVELKTGPIQQAARIQLALYGHALDPDVWWARVGVQLKPCDYSLTVFDKRKYITDVAAALAGLRWLQWKKENLNSQDRGF